MFKKALQIAVTFSLLVGGYAGYTRAFAIVVALLDVGRVNPSAVPFPEVEQKSSLKATELARESFGGSHWAAQKELKLRYYDAARGYYIYAENYERHNEGKQLRIWPFALIWVSKDGKSRKTATSNEAILDMNQPFGLAKPGGEPTHIVHAKLLGDVHLRDDKGTRDDRDDDLRVGPLTHVEYDEKTLQITTDSDVFLQDRDLTLTGIGMLIQLRRKPGAPSPGGGPAGGSGFDAEYAIVDKDVHLVVNNVTSNGILPGTAKPEKSGKTPLDLRCDREMRIDLPRPRPVVEVGPPDLLREPDPTFAKFKTNVRVLRGSNNPDQLNCDTLDLTLMPTPKPPGQEADPAPPAGTTIAAVESTPADDEDPAEGAPEPAKQDGPLTELKLRKALAKGDAVWLQSETQGLVARCVELKYDKSYVEGVPDKTYLNGGTSKKLWVEKVEHVAQGEKAGSIKTVDRLTALDATIFDYGPGGTNKVIARGPGKMEERPARNASVDRTAWWEDEMEMVTWRDGEGPTPTPSPDAARALKTAPPPPARGTLRRIITLTGVSKLIDHKSASTLDARKSIVAEFQSAPKAQPSGPDGPTEIKWLDAFEDAHLTAPSRTLTARQFLKAKFEPAAVVQVATRPAPPVGSATPTPDPTPAAPVIAANEAPAEGEPDPKPEPAPAPPEPNVDARADRVWATVLLGSGNAKGELKDAMLRGGVMVHQDPAPGKATGNDASGEALDLFGQGNGLMRFIVSADEQPQAADPKTRLASNAKGRPATTPVLARVDFDGKTIEAPLIGLDQKADYSWARGAGNFLQLADRGLLDDKGLASEKKPDEKPAGPSPKDRFVITWTEEMKFFGRSRDLAGRPAAKAEFRGVSQDVRTPNGDREFRRGVEAKMTDSAIFCDTMDVYMDREVALNKATPKPVPNPSADPAEPDAQIAMLDCRGENRVEEGRLKYAGVDITSQKTYPDNGDVIKEKQRIQHVHVLYDKRTGNFEAPGPGICFLYKRKNGSNNATVIPTAFPVGTTSRPDPAVRASKIPPLELTKIKFTEGMRGRFGVAKDQADNQPRHAEFFGNVESVNAIVQYKNSDINFDRLEQWRDSVFLSSDFLHVTSEPPPIGSKASARQLLYARGNAAARTIDRLIQADRVTYDSATELTYAYGEDGKEVVMNEQKAPGQPINTLRGKTLRYNKLTRESRFDDPQAIYFTDLASGVRPKAVFPDLGGTIKPPDPIKAQHLPFQKNARSSTERYSFTGH